MRPPARVLLYSCRTGDTSIALFLHLLPLPHFLSAAFCLYLERYKGKRMDRSSQTTVQKLYKTVLRFGFVIICIRSLVSFEKAHSDDCLITPFHIAHSACDCDWVYVGAVQLIQLFSDKPTVLKFFKSNFRVLMYSPHDANQPSNPQGLVSWHN